MPNTPIRSQNAITSLLGLPDVDPKVVEALLALYDDLQNFKTSLYGLGRDVSGDMVLSNPAYRNRVGDQEALRITKDGNLLLGDHYGVRPDVKGITLGSFYAVPQWGKWRQTSTLAGDGSFTWDTENFNNTYDLYQRTVANTRIRILVPGDYLVIANVHVSDIDGMVAGNTVLVRLFLNATSQKNAQLTYAAGSVIEMEPFCLVAMIQTTVDTDYIEVQLATTGSVGDRFGIAGPYTTLEICKVN